MAVKSAGILAVSLYALSLAGIAVLNGCNCSHSGRTAANGAARSPIFAFDRKPDAGGIYPAPLSPPNAPSRLEATPISNTQINLAWQANSNNETGFILERGTAGGPMQTIAKLGVNIKSYSDIGISIDTNYIYRVKAFNRAGDSSYSQTVSAHACFVPNAPNSLNAVPSDMGIVLKWLDNSVDEAGFKVDRSLDGITYTTIATLSPNTTSFIDRALNSSHNMPYWYSVYAFNPCGDSSAGKTSASSACPEAPQPCAVWNKIYSNGYGRNAVSDGSGNIYMADSSYDGTSTGAAAFKIIKYDMNGNELWNKVLDGSGEDWGYDITVDGLGNVYLIGVSYAAVSGAANFKTIKYDADGNELWSTTYDNQSGDPSYGIAVDGSGNVFVTGNFGTIEYKQ